jgi:4-hydroxy-tetrahydrodipicolinate synthase
VCVKEETGDIRRVTDTYIEFGDRFGVFCGVDGLIVESSALGVTG